MKKKKVKTNAIGEQASIKDDDIGVLGDGGAQLPHFAAHSRNLAKGPVGTTKGGGDKQ